MRAKPRIGCLALSTAVLCAALLTSAAGAVAPEFINFESGQVRPLALSPDGSTLFAVNTPDGQLEIFDVTASGLIPAGSVAVGMEPVAVAARSNDEVWVVNHLSDSISIVSLTGTPGVTRTLLVGDEPRDIVFAGTGGNRAFITTAHRGQHRTHSSISGVTGAGDPEFTTAGVPRADVWVFDATSLGSTIGGTPLEILELFGDTPRALAVSADGNTVYAAVFHSGNQTTVVAEPAVCNGFTGASSCTVDGETMPGGSPGPDQNTAGDPAPEVGLIVKYDNINLEWRDELNRDWSDYVQFNLPDYDVFSINANTLVDSVYADHVGTILYNMVVHPTSGKVYVSNQESPNEVRFEGPGSATTTVQGHLSEARISVLDGVTVSPRHLNSHINYSVTPAPAGTKDHSLATPLEMAISDDETTLYVAAFGSSKIGVIPISNLDSNWGGFDPTTESANYISVTGGGPSGLVLDERVEWQRMYVLTRFDNSISVVDLSTGLETSHVAMHNPEPPEVTNGRHLLYDAFFTSSNGEASCSSCHIFGDNDNLAWDLGNPDGGVTTNPLPINLEDALVLGGLVPPDINGSGEIDEFHPMKGPMTTQTLRGMLNSGALHWRGDRSQPGNVPFDELENFKNFDVAFPGLVGRDSMIPANDMDDFANFALTIALPPNPVRNLDNSLTSDQQDGEDFFLGPRRSDGLADNIGGVVTGFTCEGCHTTAPATAFFGTGGNASFEGEPQIIKIAHLRNMYTKIGMFGLLDLEGFREENDGHQGDQIRGFGFTHEGAIDTLFRFFNALVFEKDFAGPGVGFDGPQGGDVKRREVEQFMLAFDTDLAPSVGQQVTLDASNLATVEARIDLLHTATDTTFISQLLGGVAVECELTVHGTLSGQPTGWRRFIGDFYFDDQGNSPITLAALKALPATEGPLTFTCVPWGSGTRMAHNRDLDLFLNGADNCPSVANDNQADNDSDSIGDVCDSDDDNDTVLDIDDNCPLTANPGQENNDGDAEGDVCDDDDDNDTVLDVSDNCPFVANLTQDDFDSDAAGDVCDADDDNDGVVDGSDTDPFDPDVCADSDADSCDDCSIGTDDLGPLADNLPANDGPDLDSDGLCDAGDPDDDNDTVPDVSDNCPTVANIGQENFDSDAQGDVCDADDDNDGIVDGSDTNSLNANICTDSDADLCDDCAIGVDGTGPLADNTPANDGPDNDSDGLCDVGDPDDDNDTVADGSDNCPFVANSGQENFDSDAQGDVCDADDDNDGVADGSDTNSLNASVCADSDADLCDDCAIGVDGTGPLADNTPANDGPDNDSDGLCDVGDPDDDNDTVPDGSDNCPIDANTGQENFDSDAQGDVCDADDDNDGVVDGSDTNAFDPDICADSDADLCDDCSVGTDDLGPLADNLPANDGADLDSDGLCDVGDPDDDNDTVPDGSDNCPLVANTGQENFDADAEGDVCDADDDNDGVADGSDTDSLDANVCQDTDADLCDDCAIGVDGTGPLADYDPSNDGLDTDSDGLCNVGDTDDDHDSLLDIYETDTGVFISPEDTGTDPLLFDTDGDGWGDSDEISLGTDPNDPLSNPEAAVVPLLSGVGLTMLVMMLAAGAIWGMRRRGREPAC